MTSPTQGLSLLTMWSIERVPCSVRVTGNGFSLSVVGYLHLEEEQLLLRWGPKESLGLEITPHIEFEVKEYQGSTALEFNLTVLAEPDKTIKVTVMQAAIPARQLVH